jgi:hypothetical protein
MASAEHDGVDAAEDRPFSPALAPIFRVCRRASFSVLLGLRLDLGLFVGALLEGLGQLLLLALVALTARPRGSRKLRA